MTEDAYLPAISSNTSPAVGAAPLSGIAGKPLSEAEGVDEGAGFFVAGILLRFTPDALATFSAAGRDRAAALPTGARAFAAGAAGFPPCTTTLPCRLWEGVVVPWATAGPTWPATRSARGD